MTHPQLVRMFISQPSTHQPLHKLNGKRVLAAPSDEECWDVWFTDGDTAIQPIKKPLVFPSEQSMLGSQGQ